MGRPTRALRAPVNFCGRPSITQAIRCCGHDNTTSPPIVRLIQTYLRNDPIKNRPQKKKDPQNGATKNFSGGETCRAPKIAHCAARTSPAATVAQKTIFRPKFCAQRLMNAVLRTVSLSSSFVCSSLCSVLRRFYFLRGWCGRPFVVSTKVQIRKGDMLCCHHPLVQIDEIKFGSDAKEFNPKRFVGNPDLKKDVSVYLFLKCCNEVGR